MLDELSRMEKESCNISCICVGLQEMRLMESAKLLIFYIGKLSLALLNHV